MAKAAKGRFAGGSKARFKVAKAAKGISIMGKSKGRAGKGKSGKGASKASSSGS